MALTARQKNELMRTGHNLKPEFVVGAGGVSAAVLEHLRRAFEARELIKVRIDVEDRDEFRAAASSLAAQAPCEIVKLIGRIALLWRAKPAVE